MGFLMKHLRQLRKNKGLSQEALGLILNMSGSSIGGYEQEKRYPDMETVKYMASYFGVSTDYLLDMTEIPYPPEERAAYKLDDEEQEILHLLYEIPEEDRKDILTVIRKYIERGRTR